MPENEHSRLVSQNTSAKPNYVNLIGNVCAVLFLCIIIYCSVQNGVTLFSFHPILITLGWLIFMTSGVNAVTPGDLATEWMPIRLRSARHWVIQVFAGIIVSLGFIVIVINKFINEKPHFASLHAKFGLSSYILMLITMLGGLGALYSLQLKNYVAPIYTKTVHALVGLVTFCLGIITMILGTFSNWWSFGDGLRYFNLILILIVMLFTMLRPSLKIYFRLEERLAGIN